MAHTVTHRQTADLCRGLALLLHGGISLAEGAFLLALEESGPAKDLLTQLGQELDSGEALCDAMERTNAFPHYVPGMVRIGEQTGRLEESLNSLADYFESRLRTEKLLRSAVAYPGMLLVLMLGVVGVLLIKVLPIFDRVYASLGSRLTGTAAGLLHLGQLLEAALPWMMALLVMGAGIALLYSKQPVLRAKLQQKFGDRGISRKFNNARFARAMAMGLGSGLRLENSLELAQMLLSDVPGAAERCALCAARLQAGDSLADAMAAAEFLSAAQSRMLTLGLRGGNADLVMEKIAGDLADEASDALESAISRIEPAMVLGSSLLVGLILLTVMLPLLHILSSLG